MKSEFWMFFLRVWTVFKLWSSSKCAVTVVPFPMFSAACLAQPSTLSWSNCIPISCSRYLLLWLFSFFSSMLHPFISLTRLLFLFRSDSHPLWLLQWMVTLSIQPTPQQQQAKVWQLPKKAGRNSASCMPSPQPRSWPGTTGVLPESDHTMTCFHQRPFQSNLLTSSSNTSAARSTKTARHWVRTQALPPPVALPHRLQWSFVLSL